MQRIEALLQQVERFSDPAARETARELVQSIMDLHGAGLARMLELLSESGETSRAALDAFARDSLVASLLLLYELHPVDLETRVRRALEQLQARGHAVEILDLRDGVVRLRLAGSSPSCTSSVERLRQTVETALCEAAPDAAGIEIETALVEAPPMTSFIPVEDLLRKV
jgi:Fe-S cluster biogenesis protein NfuA